MIVENGKIIRCTDAELFDHWLKHFENIFPYEVYKAVCINKGTEVVLDECRDRGTRFCYEDCTWFGNCLYEQGGTL